MREWKEKWKEILIPPTTSIIKAIEIIDKSSLQIALIVDKNMCLLGVVTDGDIRRGILKGIAVDKPVKEVMNVDPTVAGIHEKRENILATMKLKRIHHIPVVDKHNRIKNIEILEDLIRPASLDNWVVLMVGGFGNRLRPLTEECPKPLLKVGGKPILETTLENFREKGFRKFYFSINYKAEMIKEYFGDGSHWGVEIRYIQEKIKMGTAGALGLLPEKPVNPILVMNGDVLTKVNFQQLLDFHLEHQAQATMCVKEYDYQVPYGVIKIEKQQLVNIIEKPVQRYFINAGVYVLEPEVLDCIPRNSYFDMPDLFKQLIKEKYKTIAFPLREYWLDIGQMADFERANGEFGEVFE